MQTQPQLLMLQKTMVVVEGVARDMSLEIQLLAALQQMGEMQANAPEEYRDAFSVDRMQTQAREQFELFTRTKPDEDLLRAAFESALAHGDRA